VDSDVSRETLFLLKEDYWDISMLKQSNPLLVWTTQ